MAKANGLAVIPESSKGVKAGDMVEVQMLDWGEEQGEVKTPMESGRLFPSWANRNLVKQCLWSNLLPSLKEEDIKSLP